MLPLLQMHPQVVPPSPHLDHLGPRDQLNHFSSFDAYFKPDYLGLNHGHQPQQHHHYHHHQPHHHQQHHHQQQQTLHQPRSSNPYHNFGSPHRSFPIRVSQSASAAPTLHRITTSFAHAHGADNGEHCLRRKTPSGTIDNGYDGSVAHLASGPPPLKHMIVPTAAKIYPTAVVQRPSNPPTTGQPRPAWPYLANTVVDGSDHPVDGLNTRANSFAGWAAAQSAANVQDYSRGDHASLLHSLPQQHNYQPAPTMQAFLGPAYQQNLSPAVFSPAAFQPTPLWRDGCLFPADYRQPIALNPGFVPHNTVLDGTFLPSQAPGQPGLGSGLGSGSLLGHAQPAAAHFSSRALDDSLSGYGQGGSVVTTPHRGLEALSLGPSTPALATGAVHDGSSDGRFRERALAQAHKAYADLLVHLSHSRKAYHGKSGVGIRSSKMVVFPKPPKQLSCNLSQQAGRGLQTQKLVRKPHSSMGAFAFGGRPGDNRSLGLPDAADQQAVAAAVAAVAATAASASAPAAHHASPVMAEILGTPNVQRGHFAGARQQPLLRDVNSPLLSARSSLDILANLCEHSGWKWADGMLLGGCLHYGLEHYEEALEWFRRIISLDESHVEAISNIAATLYCLNRQEEAEQQWVQAIEIRPSYLEAVEHLVGLLCSNQRSQDAVNTISFVQQSLRLPRSASYSSDYLSETASEPDAPSPPPSTSAAADRNPDPFALDADKDSPEIPFSSVDNSRQPGFGSSGYAIPGSENGRMLLLIHAKGNMLYALKDIDRASEAFEEAVMISAGRRVRGVRSLIRTIQFVLSPRDAQGMMMSSASASSSSRSRTQKGLSLPLLLPPEKAKLTAQLVFSSSNGQLPGLRYMPDGSHKKASISTTSNSLLSLAKIFQDAMSTGGSCPGILRQPTGVGDILALYYLSLSLQESPSTANNVGILLASVQQPASQQQQVSPREAALCQSVPGIVPGSGLSLALAYYHYGLSLDSKHVHLHTNLGSLLKDIGQLDSAIHMYEKAVQCDGTFDIALTNLANAVKDRGRINDAILYYKRAVQSNPDFAEAVCGLSTALNSVCDWRDRGGVLLYGGKYDRWHVDATGMLADARTTKQGSGLVKRVVDIVRRQLKESSTWGCGTLQDDVLAQLVSQLDGGSGAAANLVSELSRWIGRPWEGSRILRLVERAARVTMRNWYLDRYLRGSESAGGYLRAKLPPSLTIPSAPTVLPFHTFTCPLTAKDVRMISQRNALRISCSTLRSPWLPASVYEPPPPPQPHLNIGYISSDFNNHPLAHLMQSVFGFHDQTRAKAFCYATTASDRSIHRQQIEREAPVFRDASTWSSDRLINQIVQDNIHILVNLNGYTRGARNEIFAARPAPIQMSFMGFAGTLGAEWCDYLLADTTAIPPSTLRPCRNNMTLEDVFRDEEACDGDSWIYSENVIFCKDTFFCCDHAQSGDGSDERGMSWEEEQRRRWKMRKELFPNLADNKIILGNFNQLYKIDPTTFRTWLRILGAVPNAVLWLLRFPELGENNLKRTAKQWAGEDVASRIIFTDVAPKQQHITRARVCDLFLDTPECNAHTTAADVLWSSTPLLTLSRYDYKMCSRMAASILKGALPKGPEGERASRELIAADDTEYENLAICLASTLSYTTVSGYGEGSGRLAELRRLLWRSKWSCPLFDTRRWVRDLEDAYEETWRRWVAGEGGDIYL